MVNNIFVLFIGLFISINIFAQENLIKEYDIGQGVSVHFDEPVVVAMSDVGEKRWGYYQFIGLYEYPDDKILLGFHVAPDLIKAYGTPAVKYISSDKGMTWKPFIDESFPPTGGSNPVFSGDFICLPMPKAIDIKKANLVMPEPVGKFCSFDWKQFYLLEECPLAVQDYFENMAAVRWDKISKQWQNYTIVYDKRNALTFTRQVNPLVHRTIFERPPLRYGNELLYADYRTSYLREDGSVPAHLGVTNMVSQDNGYTWKRRSTIAMDPDGVDDWTEPMLAENKNGELVCVIRRSDHLQKSMMMTFSQDIGKTWEEAISLDQLGSFGVMPCLITLECGVMVLSYGRPGVWLSFSLNGTGREWTKPVCVIEGDPKRNREATDGYTTMLSIGPNQLLLTYTNFNHIDDQGNQRKAIMVRKLTIEKTKSE